MLTFDSLKFFERLGVKQKIYSRKKFKMTFIDLRGHT